MMLLLGKKWIYLRKKVIILHVQIVSFEGDCNISPSPCLICPPSYFRNNTPGLHVRAAPNSPRRRLHIDYGLTLAFFATRFSSRLCFCAPLFVCRSRSCPCSHEPVLSALNFSFFRWIFWIYFSPCCCTEGITRIHNN